MSLRNWIAFAAGLGAAYRLMQSSQRRAAAARAQRTDMDPVGDDTLAHRTSATGWAAPSDDRDWRASAGSGAGPHLDQSPNAAERLPDPGLAAADASAREGGRTP